MDPSQHENNGFRLPQVQPPPLMNPPPQIFGSYDPDGLSVLSNLPDMMDPIFTEGMLMDESTEAKRRRIARVEKKRNPPKGAKYIEGLENRLGRMESLLRLSGLLAEDDNGKTDLGTLEKRLVEKTISRRASAAPGSGPTSPSPSGSNEVATPQSTLATPESPNKEADNGNGSNGNAASGSKTEQAQKQEEVEALSDMMCSLVTNNCGETRYIGSSSGFSIFSPKGIQWVNEKTGDTSFQHMISSASVDENKWMYWKPEVFSDLFSRPVYRQLPSRLECRSLLKDFFENFNCMFPLFHQPTFMHLVDRQYSRDPYEGSGWWASLNVALAIAHRLRVMSHLVPREEDEKAWQYLKNAMGVFNELTMRNTDLLSVQALLGMALFMQGTPNPQPSFFLVAAAIRLSHSIGLHKRGSGFNLNPVEIEQRKRVFWIGYLLDKDICLRSGRPPAQDDDDMNVDLPSTDPDDNIGNIPLADGKGKVNLFRLMCEFSTIESKVYKQLYSTKASKQSDGELLNTIGELDQQLEEWKDSIPVDFRPEHEIKASHTPLILHVVVLHFAYYNCLTTIHRMSIHHGYWTSRLSNYAIQGLNARPLNPRVFSSAALCVSAARASIHLIKYVPQGDFSCVWLILYFPVSALVTLFGNILQNPQDPRARSDVRLMNVVVNFLSLLASEEENGGVKRMLGVCSEFERIAKVVLDKADKESSSRRKRKTHEDPASKVQQTSRHPQQSQTPAAFDRAVPSIGDVYPPNMGQMHPQNGFSSIQANGSPSGGASWQADFGEYASPNGMTPFADTQGYTNGNEINSPLNPNNFQQPFVPQDLWQMPMTSEWDWADMTGGAYPSFENGVVGDPCLQHNDNQHLQNQQITIWDDLMLKYWNGTGLAKTGPSMTSLLRRSSTFARISQASIQSASRKSLRSTSNSTLLCSRARVQQVRSYTQPPTPPKKQEDGQKESVAPKKATPPPHKPAQGTKNLYQGKTPLSPDHDDKASESPLAEGMVRMSPEDEETLKSLVDTLKKGLPQSQVDNLENAFQEIKRNGITEELKDFVQTTRGRPMSLSDAAKATRLIAHMARKQAEKDMKSDAPDFKSNPSGVPPPPDGKGKPPDFKYIGTIKLDWTSLLLSLFVTYLMWDMFMPGNATKEITFQEFRNSFFDKGLVEKLTIINKSRVQVHLLQEPTRSMYPDSPAANPNFHYYFTIGSVEAFEKRIDDAQRELGIPSSERIPVSYASDTEIWGLLMSFGPTLLFIGAIFYMSRRAGGSGSNSGIFGMGKSRAKRFNHETDIKVKFKDVAGMDEAKLEIMEFVSFLKSPEQFQRLGAKIPRGAILSGPPGTGKTLLAKATAGESQVPFFSVSGSEFVEMFVGVGASRVRDLFAMARKNTPCIIFIDEIDAIGKSRSKSGSWGGGNDEREATLNQILTEMDGFNTTEQIVVLAGTNRPDVLDQALLRPGRFDRHIAIDRPTMEGRKQIFIVHLRQIVTNEDMDYLAGRLAAMTPGFSGADVANCVNEAALIAARTSAVSVAIAHFEQAIERVIGGLERKSLILSPEEKKVVAYHEAGHAICGWYFKYADPLLKVSIIPRGQGALGYAQYLPSGDTYLMNVNQLMDRMAMTLGGRISEELHFPTVTSGASDDFKKVTRMATAMVTQWGMSKKLGPLHFQEEDNKLTKPFAEATAQTIDSEVRRIVDEAYKQCKDLLTEKKKEVGLVAEELLKKEVLGRDDMVRLLGKRPFEDHKDFAKYFGEPGKKSAPPPPPTPLPNGGLDTPSPALFDGDLGR
ncbi:hypothetical protein B7494_g7108 [Chlorociboria aeruginascens]|nr:hypothetical protein B7494_g7108 [Chlorociboria aeruginascens]